MKTETWLGHEIRFVEKDGEWWGVLADVAEALDLTTRFVGRRLPKEVLSNHPLMTSGGIQDMLIVNERGIYKAILHSRKKEAEEFQDWVCDILRELRRASGLESYQVFLTFDKEYQRKAMDKLHDSLHNPVRVDYIKANTIADKAVSLMYGLDKMIKKSEMTPEMLVDREAILNDAVDLIILRARFNLVISVSKAIYEKYAPKVKTA
jgi:prophage antirepressor-like protein